MTPSTSLSRLRLAGKACRSGAWLIAVLGLTVIVIFIASTIASDQANPGQNFNEWFNTAAFSLLMAILTIFFFLILFAVGALYDYISSEKNIQEVNEERVEMTSLPKML